MPPFPQLQFFKAANISNIKMASIQMKHINTKTGIIHFGNT